jgi:hypothetical protein
MAEALDALALLLASTRRRALLRSDPAALQAEVGCSESTLNWLAGLDPGELQAQAAGLVGKRRSEVCRLLPRTTAALGADAELLFAQYAEGRWPEGHRRHLDDAAGFCEYLRQCGRDDAVDTREAASCLRRSAASSRILHGGWLRALLRRQR